MFDVGFVELLVLGVLGLLILGPERLPGVAKTIGAWIGKARHMSRTLQRQIQTELAFEEERLARKAARANSAEHDDDPDDTGNVSEHAQADDRDHSDQEWVAADDRDHSEPDDRNRAQPDHDLDDSKPEGQSMADANDRQERSPS